MKNKRKARNWAILQLVVITFVIVISEILKISLTDTILWTIAMYLVMLTNNHYFSGLEAKNA